MDSADPLVGTVVAGRYEIVSLLGAGGMGVVYRARQLTMNRMVALKLLHAHYSSNKNAVARFEREMQATAKIEHPSTIRVYDYGTTDAGQLFLAMELIQGRTLAQALREDGAMPLPRQVKIGLQIGKALIAAHAEGVVHRDLKPDNVMLLDQYGEHDIVKVLDFGIARFIESGDDQRLTTEGAVIGTPAYMSPEQVQGLVPDTRTDLYALGIILYEMATGAVPFSAPTTLSLLVKHVQDAPPRPSEVDPATPVPPMLEALILQCLEKQPAARPASASEVVRRLEAIGVTASGPVTRAAATGTAAKSYVLPLVGIGLAAAIAVVVWLALRGPPTQPLSLAVADAENAADSAARSDPESATEGLHVAALEVAAPTPDIAHSAPDIAVGVAPAIETDVAPAIETDDRAALTALFVEAQEPDVPESAKTRGPPGTLEVLAKAGRLLAGGDHGPAYDLLVANKALIKDSAEGQIFLARATLYAVQSPSEAEPAAAAAVRLCDCALAWEVTGDVYRAEELVARAQTAYVNATQREPDYWPPYEKAANLLLDDAKAKETLALLDDIVRRRPDFAPARAMHGAAAFIAGDNDAALADLEAATSAAPTDGDGWLALGHVRKKAGQLDAAQTAFCKAKALGQVDAASLCPD